MRIPWWLKVQWEGDLLCPFCYVGPLLIVWDRPEHRWMNDGQGFYWPRNVRFAWNPD